MYTQETERTHMKGTVVGRADKTQSECRMDEEGGHNVHRGIREDTKGAWMEYSNNYYYSLLQLLLN